jgi:hypothetical protein
MNDITPLASGTFDELVRTHEQSRVRPFHYRVYERDLLYEDGEPDEGPPLLIDQTDDLDTAMANIPDDPWDADDVVILDNWTGEWIKYEDWTDAWTFRAQGWARTDLQPPTSC